jgi:hypothetical protein
MTVETLAPALGFKECELPACLVRASSGEIALDWTEFASIAMFALRTESTLTSGSVDGASRMPRYRRLVPPRIRVQVRRCPTRARTPSSAAAHGRRLRSRLMIHAAARLVS